MTKRLNNQTIQIICKW